MKIKAYFYLFTLVAFLLYTSCVKSQDNESLKNHFENNEIVELEKLISFFDSVVQQKTIVKDLALAYKEFLKKLSESKSAGDASQYFKFDFKVKDQVSSNLFDKIWVVEKSYGYKVKDTVLSLNINTSSEYIKLLKSKSKNEVIKKYYDGILSSGGFSPGVTAHLQHDYNKLDFNDFDNRLIVAIHYMTLNEPDF